MTVKISDQPGPRIPHDFAGLSFESSNLNPDKRGQHLFSPDDKQLIELFRAIGIRNLRVGGGTADGPEFKIPGSADIDELFGFAKAADVKVIYTLRLLNGDMQQDAAIAQYIEKHYAPQLICFQIGNEPDWHSFHTSRGLERDPRIVETTPDTPGTAYPSFLHDWRSFASEIERTTAAAKFTGPDTGSDYPVPGTKDTDFEGQSWTQRFAHDEKNSGKILFVTQHDYPGQSAAGVSVDTAVESMLSRDWPKERYEVLVHHVLEPVESEGLTYRMTEANDYTGGVDGASNAFVSALWALDYLHWHAAHGAAGVNFHNKSWIFTDTIYRSADGTFHFNPKAYAFKAFDVGSRGRINPVSISNNEGVNLTAYAVRAKHEIFVTLINKEHGPGARSASVTLHGGHFTGEAEGMLLEAPQANVTAREDITFGGAAITPSGWTGRWSRLGRCKEDRAMVLVPPASALVVKLVSR
ncbi:MAG TPA: hypothetical protein VGU25_00055 [Acidobacteriaceae bacterium]|nr:hypothetical protein [Acidobacteriaceae bacterium]